MSGYHAMLKLAVANDEDTSDLSLLHSLSHENYECTYLNEKTLIFFETINVYFIVISN